MPKEMQDQIENDDQVAEETSSPGVTDDGASSSEAEVEKSIAETIEEEFLEKYGEKEDEGAEAEESSSDADEAESEGDPDTGAKPADEAASEEEESSTNQDQEEGSTRLSEEEYKALSPKVQRRMSDLSGRVRDLTKERDEFMDGHDRFTKFNGYLEQNNLVPEDVTKSLAAASFVKSGKYQEALEILSPIVAQLQVYVGETLPSDLQDLVDNGDISEDAARLQSKDRAEVAKTKAENERLRTQNEARDRDRDTNELSSQMITFAGDLETKMRDEDPDYDRKSPAIIAHVTTLVERKTPESTEEFEELVRGAHKFVTSMSQPPAKEVPQPKGTLRRPGSTSTKGPVQRKEFNSVVDLLEANPYEG